MNVSVNKNGEVEWHIVKNALTLQDAVEAYFNVQVYVYKITGPYVIFDDVRDDVDQLYGAIEENNE
jgi:hypothetical protein